MAGLAVAAVSFIDERSHQQPEGVELCAAGGGLRAIVAAAISARVRARLGAARKSTSGRFSRSKPSAFCSLYSSPVTSRDTGNCFAPFEAIESATFEVPSWLNLPRARYALPVVSASALRSPCSSANTIWPRADARRRVSRGRTRSRGARSEWRSRCRAAGGGVLSRLSAGHLLDARRSRPHVAVRRGTTWRAAATKSPRRSGPSPAARSSAAVPVWATRAICRPAIPISCWPRSWRNSGSPGSWRLRSLFAAFIARALTTARRASTEYGFFLALTLSLFIVVPVLLMMSGTLGLIPLTGVVTPFLSFGGSAMVGKFCRVRAVSGDSIRHRTVGRSLAIPRAGTLAGCRPCDDRNRPRRRCRHDQLRQEDEIVARPHLGPQADGVSRFQYNPRLLDVVRRIPRGTIVDRNGLPMATDDPEVASQAAAVYAKVGALDRTTVHRSRNAMLSTWRPRLSSSRRRRDEAELGCAKYLVRGARLRVRAEGLRRSRVGCERCSIEKGPRQRQFGEIIAISSRRLRHRFEPDHPAVKAAMDPHRQS